jgi:lipopolysaccharide/colanic/teichoic acid biosynthesis glycosyltransferase
MLQVISVSKRVLLLAAIDYALMMGAFVAAAFLAAPIVASIYLLYEGGFTAVALAAAVGLFGLYLMGKYSDVRVLSRVSLLVELCQVFGIIFIGQAIVTYIDEQTSLHYQVLLIGSALGVLALLAWRTAYSGILWAHLPTDAVLFLGSGPEIARTIQWVRARPSMGINVIGYLGDPAGQSPEFKNLGGMEALDQILKATRPTRIVVAHRDHRVTGLQKCLFDLHLRRIPIERYATFYERVLRRVCTSQLRPSAVIFDRELDARPRSLALQSVYTNLLALTFTLLLSPLMIVLALAVRMTSRGPALQGYPRLGLNGVPFRMYEFRCHDSAGRLTKSGCWLRRRSLHMLPRLLNVVRGEMALIGPRPERPEFAAEIVRWIPYAAQRRTVRPGLIGWSQLKCFGDLGDEITRIEHDLYYIKHISLPLDAYIILTSVRMALGSILGG